LTDIAKKSLDDIHKKRYDSERRVLVISPDEKLQESISTALAQQGCAAVPSEDGVDAQKIFDVDWYFVGIIIDSRLRNPSCPPLVRLIKQKPRLNTIPVIVVTASWTFEESQQAIAAGATALVPGGSTEEQFQSVFATTIGSRTKSLW